MEKEEWIAWRTKHDTIVVVERAAHQEA